MLTLWLIDELLDRIWQSLLFSGSVNGFHELILVFLFLLLAEEDLFLERAKSIVVALKQALELVDL